MTRRLRSLLLPLVAGVLSTAAGAQVEPRQWAADPLVHELLRAFRRERGGLPARLEELCSLARGAAPGCPPGFAERYFRDAWGRPPRVEPARGDTAYVLRSAGADGRLGTPDDLLAPDEAVAWRELLLSAAGCYAWLPGAGRALGALADDVPRFELDTLAGGFGAALGSYELHPAWAPDSASATDQRAVWRPRAPDTLFLSWGTAFGGTGVRLVMQGDVLRGDAGLYSDARVPAGSAPPSRRAVSAVRVGCPGRPPNVRRPAGSPDERR